jgi:hypothetical protein
MKIEFRVNSEYIVRCGVRSNEVHFDFCCIEYKMLLWDFPVPFIGDLINFGDERGGIDLVVESRKFLPSLNEVVVVLSILEEREDYFLEDWNSVGIEGYRQGILRCFEFTEKVILARAED